jgi:hypothetical protein
MKTCPRCQKAKIDPKKHRVCHDCLVALATENRSRDLFAAHALQGLVAAIPHDAPIDAMKISAEAYDLADALLKTKEIVETAKLAPLLTK